MPPLYDVHQSVCLVGFGLVSFHTVCISTTIFEFIGKKIICPGVTPLSVNERCRERYTLFFEHKKVYQPCQFVNSIWFVFFFENSVKHALRTFHC